MKLLVFLLCLITTVTFGQPIPTPANQVLPTWKEATHFTSYSTARQNLSFSSQTADIVKYNFPAGWASGGSEGATSTATANGYVYTIPASGSYIYRFDPSTNSTKRISVSASGYLKGPTAPNGKIYMLPFSTNSIGVFDPSNETFYTITASISAFHGSNYYNGACLGPDGNIWAAPGKGTDGFLKIVPGSAPGSTTGDTFSFVGSSPSMSGITTSWFANMITASDGKMYAIPFDGNKIYKVTTGGTITQPFTDLTGTGLGQYASAVEETKHPGTIICIAYGGGTKPLKINITAVTWSLLSTQTGGYGGCTEGLDFKIICAPQHSTTIGVFDPETDLLDETGTVSAIANNDTIGACLIKDGRILFGPGNTYWLVYRSALTVRIPDEIAINPYHGSKY